MRNPRINILLGIAVACLVMTTSSWALDASKFATSSKLASGKWVKIKVPETGVYQLTDAELAEMGFSNPAAVRIFGNGGYMMNEVLDGSAIDDLQPVAVKRVEGKICFYAKGPVSFSLEDATTQKPRYDRTINAYSTVGCYFLTEASGDDAVSQVKLDNTAQGDTGVAHSLDFFYHEQELVSAGFSGKVLLGELVTEAGVKFACTMPGITKDMPICINPSVAGYITEATSGSSVAGTLSGRFLCGGVDEDIDFPKSETTIRYSDNHLHFYNLATPKGMLIPSEHSETAEVELKMNIPSDLSLQWARLDRLMITYWHKNALTAGGKGQFRMGYNNISDNYRIELPEAPAGLVVWNVTNEDQLLEYTPVDYTDSLGNVVKAFSPKLNDTWAQFVAFNPADTLMQIRGYEQVENQNLHALEVPDMLIVTNSVLQEQAERVAELHRLNDGYTVHVVDQEKIFNEFSSGAPDAMGVRLLCKMFYDRNPQKFKYLLMFGCGSYDNRGLTSSKKNRVITYESDNSNDEDYSYVSDDFFGTLADNTGKNITLPKELLSIGVGRITSASVSEAKSDVDKLINYVNDPDYGVWRNNAITTSDEGDANKHVFQAVGIEDIMNKDLKTGLVVDKAYIDIFPNASSAAEPGVEEIALTAVEARRHLTEALQAGQYYWTYVGHAGQCYTKRRHMWTKTEVQNVSYVHPPVFSAACCDVARYDGDVRCIADMQFHKKQGGVISVFTASRSVYSDNNDRMNRAWVERMFSAGIDSPMPRLGDAYLASKQVFSNRADAVPCKVKYQLFGDPAMQLNYPRPLFKVETVNGVQVNDSTTATTKPMQQLTVTARVLRPDGETTNTDFTGDAYLTLYDVENKYKDVTVSFNGKSTLRTINYPRNQLAQVLGRVEKGVFTATLMVPRYVESQNQQGMISVYAHNDNTTEMVNGIFTGLNIATYDAENAVVDTQAPVIEKMFFGNESQFEESAYIPSSTTLYITATDDVAISNKSVGLNSAMTLQLDGGKSTFNEVKSTAVVSNEGKQLEIALPMNNLELGSHSLTFTVSDAAGNQSSRTVEFLVGPASEIALSVEETPVTNQATFAMETQLIEAPEVTVKVTDAAGNLVWVKTTTTFPVQWDLTDKEGKKVKPGVYRYWGIYNTGASGSYGGTDISRFIVL